MLDDAAVRDELARLRERAACASAHRHRAAPGRRRSSARCEVGGFDAVQATWNLLERSAGPALAARPRGRAGRDRQGGAGQRAADRARRRGRAAGRAPRASAGTTPDALALAAVLAQPWVDVVLSGAATVDTLRSNLARARRRLGRRARGGAGGAGRAGRGVLGAALGAGLELARGHCARPVLPPWPSCRRRESPCRRPRQRSASRRGGTGSGSVRPCSAPEGERRAADALRQRLADVAADPAVDAQLTCGVCPRPTRPSSRPTTRPVSRRRSCGRRRGRRGANTTACLTSRLAGA